MARKLRLEFPGACYRIINRGNYRADIFRTDGAKAAFEACLFEACEKSGWRLHAWCLMSNHYHLAVSTWLKSTTLWLRGNSSNNSRRRRRQEFGALGLHERRRRPRGCAPDRRAGRVPDPAWRRRHRTRGPKKPHSRSPR